MIWDKEKCITILLENDKKNLKEMIESGDYSWWEYVMRNGYDGYEDQAIWELNNEIRDRGIEIDEEETEDINTSVVEFQFSESALKE